MTVGEVVIGTFAASTVETIAGPRLAAGAHQGRVQRQRPSATLPRPPGRGPPAAGQQVVTSVQLTGPARRGRIIVVSRVWGAIAGFGRFWYGFIIGDDWMAAAGVVVMPGAAYGLLRLGVAAWWSGPVIITATLLITLRRAGQAEQGRQQER